MTFQPTKNQMLEMTRMVGYNAGIVRRRAPDVSRDDLMSEGYLALTLVMRRYDPSSPASLWTFAEPRVRGAMLDLVKRTRRPGVGKRSRAILPQLESYDAREAPHGHGHVAEARDDPADDRLDLGTALELLTPEQRWVVLERIKGATFDHIASDLLTSRESVRRIYAEAVKVMRAGMGVQTDIS